MSDNTNNQDTPNSTDGTLKNAADDVKEVQDKIDAGLNEKCPEGLESHENTLFHEISTTVIKILTDPATQQAFASIANKLNNVDISKELVELVATTVTYATYNSIAFYDTTVKELISENFKEIGDIVMTQGSNIEVLQMKVGDIEKKALLSKAQNIVDKEE